MKMLPASVGLKLAGITLLIVVLYLFAFRDEQLSAVLSDVIQSQPQPIKDEENAFIYVLGFDSGLQSQVVRQGKKIKASIIAHKPLYLGLIDANAIELPEIDSILRLPEEAAVCLTQQSCRMALINDKNRLEAQLQSESGHIFLQRFSELLNKKYYQTSTGPNSISYFPSHQAIIQANDLRLLQFFYHAISKQNASAVEQLIDDNVRIKKHLFMSDNLLYKGLMVTLLEKRLLWLEQAYRQGVIKRNDFASILKSANIPEEAARLDNYVKAELPKLSAYYLSQQAQEDMNKRYLFGAFKAANDYTNVATPLIFKPIATLNAIEEKMARLIQLSAMNTQHYRQALEQSDFLNPVKPIYLSISIANIEQFAPDFKRRLDQVHRYNHRVVMLEQRLNPQFAKQ